jgi:hypothetical protein
MNRYALIGFCILFAASSLQADTIWSYNFNHLSDGSIASQDGWVNSGFAGWTDLQVASVLGADGNYSKAVTAPVDVVKAHGDYRAFAAGSTYTYTSADTAIVESFQIFTGTQPGTGTLAREASGGLRFTDANTLHTMVFGILTPNNTVVKTHLRTYNSSTLQYGDTLANDSWYDVRLIINFSTLKGSIEYCNLTAGQTTYTPDSLLKDKALGIPVAGSYTLTGLRFRAQGGTWIDNFKLNDPNYVIPEPSTLALLAAGLVGLLAYAWRKRR